MYSFEKLKVWQASVAFLKNIYNLIDKLPPSEKSNLADQLRRASTSISLNIAEGSSASSKVEFLRYLHIARKSTYEVMAILKILEEIYRLDTKKNIEDLDELGRMLNGLIRSLQPQAENRELTTED